MDSATDSASRLALGSASDSDSVPGSDSAVVQDSVPDSASVSAMAMATVFEPASATLSAVLSSALDSSPARLLQFLSPSECDSCAHAPLVPA